MTTMIVILAALAALLSGWAFFNVYRSRQWIEEIQHELAQLAPTEGMPAETGPPTLECVIRLRDPLEVAEKESKLAWTVTGIAPNLVTREVYRQVREESLVMLARREIDADVLVRVR